MADVEILAKLVSVVSTVWQMRRRLQAVGEERTLMPSSEKQGGTADDSSSASESRMGNFSTADMGMSPR